MCHKTQKLQAADKNVLNLVSVPKCNVVIKLKEENQKKRGPTIT